MMRAVPNSPVEEDRLAVREDRLDGACASIEPIGYVQDKLIASVVSLDAKLGSKLLNGATKQM